MVLRRLHQSPEQHSFVTFSPPADGRSPEDCGGIHCYAEFLLMIADPDRPEQKSMLQ